MCERIKLMLGAIVRGGRIVWRRGAYTPVVPCCPRRDYARCPDQIIQRSSADIVTPERRWGIETPAAPTGTPSVGMVRECHSGWHTRRSGSRDHLIVVISPVIGLYPGVGCHSLSLKIVGTAGGYGPPYMGGVVGFGNWNVEAIS